MASNRSEKVADLLKKEIALIISNEIKMKYLNGFIKVINFLKY